MNYKIFKLNFWHFLLLFLVITNCGFKKLNEDQITCRQKIGLEIGKFRSVQLHPGKVFDDSIKINSILFNLDSIYLNDTNCLEALKA